ncbi:unnamed protein product [Kuraishia capsulata CBS 1993]|uniref:Acyl-CoA desaturase n=1 Tax=Kuraishia capsulata CBS 1993 TaxID=1382522 RepID=W6MKZ9_9ASCO|nr:uncharacterized protein KUCA_T00001427001 [Kuraishia capsulata CBS 1993]CDK25457.1 unnamed protein product [Kuraishia capsulata CBS 1993]
MSVPAVEYSKEEIRRVLADDEGSRARHRRPHRHRVKQDTAASTIRRHISESSWTIRNWWRHIHWRNFVLVVVLPALALLSMWAKVPLTPTMLKWSAANYLLSCLAVTAGYHRYWAHRTFQTHRFVAYLFAAVGAGAGIGPAKWWCGSHRAHHRYCDTQRDPSNIRRGFWYSHFGWMLLIHHPKVQKAIHEFDEDLGRDPVVVWQYDNYARLVILYGFAVPTAVAAFWMSDLWGGLVYAGLWRMVLVQQTMFAFNSLAHCVGSQPLDNRRSPRNAWLLSLITFGEGNHNFHHEFSSDYRNGYEWYNLDPAKWAIYLLSLIGMTWDLHRVSKDYINQSLLQQEQKLLDAKRAKLNWGIPIERLPTMLPEEFKRLATDASVRNKSLVVVEGIVHDVTPFVRDHPGGVALIKKSEGRDASVAFNGGVYNHSNAAHNLLATMRIAKLVGSEKLFWKQQQIENKEIPWKNDSEGVRIVRSGEQVTMSKTPSTTAEAA